MKNVVVVAMLSLSVGLALTSPASAFSLRNKANMNQCLAIPASNVTNGTPMITYHCDGTPNQQWTYSEQNFPVHLRNGANHNKCLTAHGADGDRPLQIWDCGAGPLGGFFGQNWVFESFDSSGTCFYFHSTEWGNEVMGVAGGNQNLKDGGSVILWPLLAGHDDQVWCLGPSS